MDLYREDSYIKSLKTKVSSVKENEGRRGIALVDNILHPQGGGQPRDRFKIWIEGKEIKIGEDVEDIKPYKGNLYLYPDVREYFSLPKKGDQAYVELDWDYRYMLMQLHTASHLFMACLRKHLKGFQSDHVEISPDCHRCVMAFDSDIPLNDYILKRVMNDAFNFIEQSPPIRAHNFDSMMAAEIEFGELLRQPKIEFKNKVRIIEIEGVDANPCGGTHVKKLAEVGTIKILAYTQQTLTVALGHEPCCV